MKNIVFLFLVMILSQEVVSSSITAFPDPIKLHITFNQPTYLPGDTAYFRGYLLNANSLEYVPGMNVVNIKLLDQNSKTLLFDKVLFFEGVGINQIIFPADLPSGVYGLIAYSDEMMRTNDLTSFFRSVIVISGKKEARFKDNVKQADSIKIDEKNQPDVQVELNMQHEYGIRTPVPLGIKINTPGKWTNKADFSISVYSEELFPTIPNTGFSAYKKLANSDTSKQKSPKPIYFSGRAYFTATKKAVPDSTFITFYLNHQMVVYGMHTKKDGRFNFPLFMALEDDDVFYAMEYKGKLLKDVKIDVVDYSVELKAEIPNGVGSAPDPNASFSILKRKILGSFNYFSDKKEVQPPHVYDEEDFDVDYTVNLNKFKEFPSMEVTLHEIVPLVQCRLMNGKTDVRVFMYTAMLAKRSPLYIIDGIMTDSTEYFLGLDPSQLSSIGVIRSENNLKKYGALGKNGILVVTTKGISDNTIPISSSVLSITGVNKSYKFSSVEYKTETKRSSRIPDLRTALYWNPKVVTDQDGNAKVSFYTGDVTGSFRVQIEGITGDGFPFSYSTLFSVSEKRP